MPVVSLSIYTIENLLHGKEKTETTKTNTRTNKKESKDPGEKSVDKISKEQQKMKKKEILIGALDITVFVGLTWGTWEYFIANSGHPALAIIWTILAAALYGFLFLISWLRMEYENEEKI